MAAVAYAQTVRPRATHKVDIIGQTATFSSPQRVANAPSAQLGTLLQSARTGSDFHITISGLPNQLMELELGFAELVFGQAGQRVFDVFVNDKRALSNFDILAAAGGPFKAVTRRFTITPRNGFLDFQFVAVTGEAAFGYIRLKGAGLDHIISVPKDPSGIVPSADAEEALASSLPPFNEETGEISLDEMTPSWPSAMPVGGVGAGKLEVLPNGEFANLTINNNWDLPIPRAPGTFVAVAAKATSGAGIGRLLRVRTPDSGANLYTNARGFLSAAYKAFFPLAEIVFRDEKFPLDVRLETFSTLIPQEESASSLPAAVFYVHLYNPKNYPISAGVAFSWEDVNGRGGSRIQGDQFPYLANSTFSDAATSSIQGILIRGSGPIEGRRGTFAGDYFIGSPAKRAVISRTLYWNPRSGEIPWWRGFLSKMRLERRPPTPVSVSAATAKGAARTGPAAVAVCASINIAPKESRRIPFIVSWYVPHVTTLPSGAVPATTEGQDYATTFGSSLGVASYIAANRLRFEQQTREWHDMISRSNMPVWLKAHTMNSLAPLLSNSILLAGSRFSMLESAGDMGGMMGPLDLRMVSQPLLLTMFPSLDRNELDLYSRAQTPEGRMPRYVGNIHGGWTGMDPKQLGEDWVDPTAAWLLQVSAYYRSTGDLAFVKQMLPAVEKARTYLQSRDPERDGVPAGGNALESVAPGGTSPLASGVMVAASMRAASGLLHAAGQAERAGIVAASATELAAKLEPTLRSYGQSAEATTATLAVAFAGNTALRLQGLAPLFPDEMERQALSIIQANHLAGNTPAIAVEVDRDGTVAKGVRTMPLLVQAFLGVEALAAGKADLGLQVLRRTYDVATGVNKLTWRQPGNVAVPDGTSPRVRSHTASLGAWAAMQALSGTAIDVPTKTLFVSPSVPSDFQGEIMVPVFTTAFWGWLDYSSAESTGTLAVTKVMSGFEDFEFQRVARGTGADGKLLSEVTFEKPFKLREGEVLKFDGWPLVANGTVTVDNPEMREAEERSRAEREAQVQMELTSGTLEMTTGTKTLEDQSTGTDDTETTGGVYGP